METLVCEILPKAMVFELQWSHAQPNVETGGFRLCSSRIILLQWSHAQPNVETRPRRSSFQSRGDASMEPRSAERGNAGSPGRAQSPSGGFNGATLSRTWKQLRELLKSATGSTASMEPRSAERGNRRISIQRKSFSGCFNGATLSRTWKPLTQIRFTNSRYKLQWSHAQPNVETGRAA